MGGFRFREFEVSHDRCAMKVGTDGVLIGAWCDVSVGDMVLDVGTGSGLIALMVAQRNGAAWVDAIDVDDGAVEQARENVSRSLYTNRIRVMRQDFAEVGELRGEYDLIVSNPPFYTADTVSPDRGRSMARNASSLPFDVLMRRAAELLAPKGELAVVVPVDAAQNIISLGAEHGLYLTRRTDVADSPKAEVKRVLMAFGHEIRMTERSKLYVHNEWGERSEDMCGLTGEFYL